MFERFTERGRQVVVLSQEEARALDHNYIGTEHLLLGLLREEEGLAARVLDSFGISVEVVREDVERVVGRGDGATSGQIPFTPRAKKVLELSLRESISLGHNYIGTEHILLGLVRENEGVAARILLEHLAEPDQVRARILAHIEPGGGGPPPYVPRPRPHQRQVLLASWEYRLDRLESGDFDALQSRLGELGAEGWQLVTTVPDDGGRLWVFQRPADRIRRPDPE